MKASINREFLEQTSFDSSAPSGLGAVAHHFKEPGEYIVTYLHEEKAIERIRLVVVADSATQEPSKPTGSDAQHVERPAQRQRPVGEQRPLEEPPSKQVDLNFSTLRRLVREQPVGAVEQHFTVGADGHAVFTASTGEAVHAIVAERTGGGEPFDSRRLGAADMFAVTLIRPGTYSVTNGLTGAQGKITVAYPTMGKEPYRPPQPVSVESTERGFVPNTIDLQPAQGIIFRFSIPSRIKIDLVEPNDGPGIVRQPRKAGWRKFQPRGNEPRSKG